jgi:hypothetical protein
MGRFPNVAARISLAGALALITGSMMVVGVTVQEALSGPAFAASAPYETFCPGTPLGSIVLNDVVVTGALAPASPTVGQPFNLTGFQTQEQLPATIVQSAEATGLTSLAGTLNTTIDATGATPSSLSTGPVAFSIPLPNPVPPSGVMVAIPAVTVGPFTATSDNISLSSAPESQTMDIDGDNIGLIQLHCSSYPNDSLPGGFTNNTPPGLPISPVIATAGQVTPPPPSSSTGPYELYCPHTPVGDLVFNDVTTSASISPATLSAGDTFHVTGYQTDIPVPAGAVTAAVGLGNGGFDGLATSSVDAYGATSSQVSTGSMGFDVPIPNPVPSTGLTLDIPSSPATVGPFTAVGGPVTIAQDQSVLVVAELSNKAFKMSCTAYPNDSVATSGSTGSPPDATPIRPIIATADASGTPITTTTTTFQPGGPGPGTQTPGAPYELYCPSTPVGDIAINDVATTASITPTSLNEGDTFQVTNLQTQFSIPQSVVQQVENLGLTTLSGDLSMFLNVTGTEYGGFNPGPVVSSSPSSPATTSPGVVNPGGPVVIIPPYPGPFPGPFPGIDDMSFSLTLPSPVPSTGVQFTATLAPGSLPETFIAAGGPIQVFASSANLNVSAFGDRFGLFCDTLANNSVPTGLSIHEPFNQRVEPLITTGSATITPTPPGAPGAYELYCPGTPVGNIALNNVDTTGSITPANPTPGEQFNVTGYQNTLTIPPSIASAAAALGNSAITGTATASVNAAGATPAQISTGALAIDVPLPSPIPGTGVTLTLPTPATTIGPFTASSSGITISQDASIELVLVVSGSDLTLRCAAYPNNSLPSGIVSSRPPGAPMSPVIATAGGGAPGTASSPTLSVSPSTGLAGGESVTLTGSGYQPATPGNVLECNTAPGQPTVTLGAPVSASLSVGCTAPSYNLVTTSATGALSTTYNVIAGTVGPPCGAPTDTITVCPGADSVGLDPANDAANYPCPPTAAQQAAGVTCTLTYGDLTRESATAPIVFSGETPPPPTTPTSTTTTTTTAGPSTPSGEITQAYQTLFDFADPSVADKVAVIQNGSSIEAGLSQALSSSLAASATGANVTNISFLDSSGCTQAGLPSPCASVTFDILGPGGTAILPGNNGYAVSINGSWLVATNTVCALLGLFYQASGKTGTPPGCLAPTTSTTTTTTIVVSGSGSGSGSSTTGTAPDSPGVASTTSSGPTTTNDAPATTAAPSTSTSQGSSATAAGGSSTTVGVATKANAGSSSPTTADPVTASSGSLAFTGLGGVTWWLGVVGGALMLVGFALLVLVDTPRRLVFRIAQSGPDRRPKDSSSASSSSSSSSSSVSAHHGTAPGETLWISER